MNVEELAKSWAGPKCDDWEEATVLSRALLVALKALDDIQAGNGNYLQICFDALAKIRGTGRDE